MKKIIFNLVRYSYRIFLFCFLSSKSGVYRLFLKRLGSNAKIYYGSQIVIPWNVEIGDNFLMSRNGLIGGAGGIKIGDDVMFGPNVTLLSSTHPYDDINIPMVLQNVILKDIKIGDDVWLGANVVVMPGIKIGNGAIVGANSVVTHDVEPYGIYCGAPARKIKSRLKNENEKNI